MICGTGTKGPRASPSLAQSLASPRLLTHADPAGGRGLEALVTEAAEGALRVVAEAVAPAHRVVGTLVYVCGQRRLQWRVCSVHSLYLLGILTYSVC